MARAEAPPVDLEEEDLPPSLEEEDLDADADLLDDIVGCYSHVLVDDIVDRRYHLGSIRRVFV